ncbi:MULTISPECIES: abortive infection system toxin AbiGii family protein [Staphylococcus]|uniref:abortive infection system toxin AbiGii family protein n=1 Tax=Staphylococcus TaxID=1279 RepID=UPI0008A4CD9C|nr:MULTISPECIES: abortive infection system toxin AbiGii family protein [Staphylococcus]OFU78962.1 hypothetical protein HMPREF3110_05245 [Staphylococcus sp. HMSC10C03]PNZ42881.1 hypothetical protein CD112_09050 [Staphylococcus simulans]SQE72975.1 Uncharacterised protein [Staphylococcus simulans]
MKINFEKNNKYPEKLEEYYSDELLEELLRRETNARYKYDSTMDKLKLTSDHDMTFNINIPKSNLPDDVNNINDLDNYLYNSQSEIKLDEVNNKAFIEGHQIYLHQLVINKNGKPEDYELIIAPSPFDKNDVVDWKLSYDGKEKNIILKRVPNKKSAYTKKYGYDKDGLQIELFIKKNDISLAMRTNEEKNTQTCVSHILDTYAIQYAFLTKVLLINGINLNKYKKDEHEYNQDKVLTVLKRKNFWMKVKKIENLLGVKFNVLLPITNEQNEILDKLIVSLLFNESIREQGSITSVELNFSNNKELEEMKNKLKNEKGISTFAWKEKKQIELFKQTLNLFQFFSTSNIKIKEFEELNDNTLKIFIKERNDDGMIVSSKFYLMNDNEDIKIDQKAKYLQEYWEKIYSNS